jgi:RNA polymerase sigma-70 factor (ECF subfamily)
MADGVAWDTVKRAAAGDAEARRELVEATLDDVWTLALRLTRRHDLADDVVQETYTRVLASLGRLEPNGRFEGYLAKVATNVVLERWRRERPALEVSEAITSPAALEPWQTVADEEDDRRRLAAIWAAASRLEPPARAAMLLYYAQGESYDEIARILEVPVGTLKTWLYRARVEVRRGAEALLRRPSAVARTRPGDVS